MPIRGYRIPNKRKTKVAYYDGSTLLGVKKYSKGKDVLHPSITVPTKSNYTFIGWATSNSEDDWVSTLIAEGKAIKLYAIYLPNTLTVVSGSIVSGQNGPEYSSGTFNTSYVSGYASAHVELWYHEGGANDTKTLTLNKKHYQTADATVGWDARAYGSGSFDNTQIGSGDTYASRNFSNLADGNHTIYTSVYSSQTTTWYISTTGVTNLTLSNPIAWT